MRKLILTVGCPGSGKTTWAKEQAMKNGGLVVNRDDLRLSMFGYKERSSYKHSKNREKQVSIAQFAQARALLESNESVTVIVADTNLNPITRKKWTELATELNVEVVHKPIWEEWEVLLKRNQYRGPEAVPTAVLRQMFYNMRSYMGKLVYSGTPGKPAAVIFDLDGTLADNNHRSPFDLAALGEDKPRENVVALAKMLQISGVKVITVSGRESGTSAEPLCYRVATIDWLNNKAKLFVEDHFQRAQGDARSDAIVKEEIFFNKIADKYNVLYCVDDRNKVVETWRAMGLECWQVAEGDF